MRKFGKIVLAFILSVILAILLASLFSTQFVIADLQQAGAKVGWSDRLSMSLYDLGHLGRLYGIFIFLGLLIAFLAATLVHYLAKTRRKLIYVVAGMTCFVVMLYLMQAVFFGVPIIAGARSGLGLVFQALAGGFAGYVFARLTGRKTVNPEQTRVG